MRGPETGLVMLRGRIGGGGAPFNFGEATVTRATVRLPGGAIGHSYALGRDKEKARLAAIADALWQDPAERADVEAKVLAPLRAARRGGRRQAPRRDGGDQGRFLHPGARRRLMLAQSETIDGGFADPVFDAQAVFKAVMDAMARPGTMSAVKPLAAPPPPLSPTAAAVALTLCDHDTPLWLDPALQASAAVRSCLAFHTGAPPANTPSDAAFALVSSPAELIALENFAQGDAGISGPLDDADPAGRQPVVGQRAGAARPGHRDHRRRSRRGRCRAISPSSGSRTTRASRAAST